MRQNKQQRSHAPVQQEETQPNIPKQQKQQNYESVQSQGQPKSAPQKHSSKGDMPQSSRFFRMLQTLTETLPEGAGMRLTLTCYTLRSLWQHIKS